MSLESRLALSLALAVAVVYWTTPVAIRLAARFEFYDKPVGYKGHLKPTPYLGGTAVMAGFLTVLVVMTDDWERTAPVVGGAILLWIVGTVDDRRTVAWWLRVIVELALATVLWSLDLGWDVGISALDLPLTCLWVLAVVNALNLFDNMDGQASTMAAVIAAAVAVLGLIDGQVWLVAAGGALAGACLGFLPHNLASPSRIFLGDGGSMPVGFALAALVMIGAGDAAAEWQALAVGLMLVGVPALDTTLVIISRRRRGISVLTGGRDHLTHRTRERLRTARAVAMALGGGQALLAVLALFAYQGGSGVLLGAVLVYLVMAGTVISLIDEAPERAEPPTDAATIPARRPPRELPLGIPWEALVLVPLGMGMALSPFAEGFYESAIWAPTGLGLIVVLVAGLIARPPRLSGPAMLALAGVAAYGAWALLSASWADSAQQAIVEGNRWLVYAVLLGVLVTLVRSTRTALWLLGAVGATSSVVVVFEMARFAVGGGEPAFLGGRLHEPLEYINALGTFHVVALFFALALAEHRKRPWAAGLGMGLASVTVLLLLLSQSRGVALAAAAAAVMVVLVIPGRVRRTYGVLVLLTTAVLLSGRATDIYDSGTAGRVDADLLQETARIGLLAAVATGVAWGVLATVLNRLEGSRPLDLERLRKGCLAGLAVLAAVVLVGGVATAGRVTDEIDQQYDAFVKLSPAAGGEATGSRLVSGAGNRYDYWRIAKDGFKADPVAGSGAGNYDARYFLERSTAEDIRQPHSLVLQTLSELGAIGGLLLLAMLGGVTWALWRARRAGSEGERVAAVAATGVFAAWFTHTNVDWIHLVPGITAMALVAVAVLVRPDQVEESAPRKRLLPAMPQTRYVVVPLVAAAVLLAGVSLSRQTLSEHYARQADDAIAADPDKALDEANRALRLQPELVPALYTKAAALARFGDAGGAEGALQEARRREPDDFVTYALLGDLSARRGNFAAAKRNYAEALQRNPLDPALQALVRDPRSAVRPTR